MKIYDLFSQNLTDSKVLFEFKTMNFFPFYRGWIWYSVFHLILIAAVYYLIQTGAWPFASFSLILAGAYILQTLKEPEVFDFKITEDSLQLNQKQVFYKDLRGFFVDSLSQDYQVLHLIPSAKRFHESTIQLFNLPEQKIVSLLKLRVPYLKDASPSLIDRITFILKI